MNPLIKRLAARWRRRPVRNSLLIFLLLVVVNAVWHGTKSLPDGLGYRGEPRALTDAIWLVDRTYIGERGERIVEQAVFDEMFRLIDGAQRLIVADQFLFNDWQGPIPETTRALSGELVQRLIARKKAVPSMRVVLITDPLNTLYGGAEAEHLASLRDNGIEVVLTNLDALRDSHVPYSPFWRLLAKPFGNAVGSTLPNPIGPGRVTVRTYLKLLNFKANHRKTLIVDQGDELVGLVSSANPHNGSSAHDNVAIRFGGAAVLDLLATENAVLKMSDAPLVDDSIWRTEPAEAPETSGARVQVLTEGAIRDALVEVLESATEGDVVDVMVFYLSERRVVAAMLAAHEAGASLRVLLDPNKDAFGREKSGLPNRAVAYDLHVAGVPVRWCDTNGEQCHAKYLVVRRASGVDTLITGSANFTRRNLANLNLETDVRIDAPGGHEVIDGAVALFDSAWSNEDKRRESLDYAAYAEDRVLKRWLSAWMERTGMSTF